MEGDITDEVRDLLDDVREWQLTREEWREVRRVLDQLLQTARPPAVTATEPDPAALDGLLAGLERLAPVRLGTWPGTDPVDGPTDLVNRLIDEIDRALPPSRTANEHSTTPRGSRREGNRDDDAGR